MYCFGSTRDIFIVRLRNVLCIEIGDEAVSGILQCETSTMKLIMDCSSLVELKSYEHCSSLVCSIESVTRGLCYALQLKRKDLLQTVVETNCTWICQKCEFFNFSDSSLMISKT